jgi:hypothetical protein
LEVEVSDEPTWNPMAQQYEVADALAAQIGEAFPDVPVYVNPPRLTLAEFLDARIAEDWHAAHVSLNESDTGRMSRDLADCEAKKRIVELAATAWTASDCTECNEAGYLGDEVLSLLALPYSDHPDYDEAWRP